MIDQDARPFDADSCTRAARISEMLATQPDPLLRAAIDSYARALYDPLNLGSWELAELCRRIPRRTWEWIATAISEETNP